MTGLPGQLTLDLPHRPALEAEDFLISRSNQAASDIVDRWPRLAASVGGGGGAAGRGQDASGQRLAPEVGRGEVCGGSAHESRMWRVPMARSWSRTCTPASAISGFCSTC